MAGAARKLTIRLQPDEGVDIQILNKVPGLDHKHNLQTTKLDLSYSETFNQTHGGCLRAPAAGNHARYPGVVCAS